MSWPSLKPWKWIFNTSHQISPDFPGWKLVWLCFPYNFQMSNMSIYLEPVVHWSHINQWFLQHMSYVFPKPIYILKLKLRKIPTSGCFTPLLHFWYLRNQRYLRYNSARNQLWYLSFFMVPGAACLAWGCLGLRWHRRSDAVSKLGGIGCGRGEARW